VAGSNAATPMCPGRVPARFRPRSRRMARVSLILLTGAICLLMAASAAAEDEARDHLQRMSEAMHSLSYEGVFVYTQGDRAETMHVVHGAGEGEPRERVTALTGKRLEVIRHGEHLVCLMPDDGRAIIGRQPHDLLPRLRTEDLDSVPPQYRARSGVDTRIAGREAHGIELEPVDGYRYGVRLWIDHEHGLLLRSELLNTDGGVLERLLFTELDVVEHVDADTFEFDLDGYARVDEFMSPAGDGGDGPGLWLDPELPPGFDLVAVNTRPRGDGNGVARQHAVFSDGLASLSMFIDANVEGEGVLRGQADRGALRVRSRRLGGYRVTLIGAVPQTTLDFLFASLERAAASAPD